MCDINEGNKYVYVFLSSSFNELYFCSFIFTFIVINTIF